MSRKGFALVELLTLGVVAVVLGGLLLLFGAGARNSGRLGEDLNRLRFHAWATDTYARDKDDRFWAMDWGWPHQNSQWDDLNQSDSPYQAANDQAIDIVRRLADPTMPRITVWLANRSFAHLALADHLGLGLPDERFLSTADPVRIGWQRDPSSIDPMPARFKPWAYSSSFLQPLDFAVPVYGFDEFGFVVTHFWPFSGSHDLTGVTDRGLYEPQGRRRRSEVLFPSSLVQVHDTHARHFPTALASGTAFGPLYHTYEHARVAVLMAGGSAGVRRTGATNPGWTPGRSSVGPGRHSYTPDLAYEAPTLSGQARDITFVHYRWTRGGLRGRDFGPESRIGLPRATAARSGSPAAGDRP